MEDKTKTYTIPEKNFLRHAARGMGIGEKFMDHGRTMRVTAIGKVYRDGRERRIDIEATEISSSEEVVDR